MKLSLSLVLTASLSGVLVTASPAKLDARALAIERAIDDAPVERDFELEPRAPTSNGPVTTVAADMIADWQSLAHYQAAVNCGPSKVKAWTCGAHCTAIRKPRVIVFGGDNGLTPHYYVANNGSHVIVSLDGTNVENPLSIAVDLNFAPRDVSASYFANAGDVRVHRGFYGAFTRVAAPIARVVNAEVAGGTKQVVVIGHSLGAAVGELLATYLVRLLGTSATVQARFFASPRVGNAAWANYVDGTFAAGRFHYLVNFNDPVPHLPPMGWGFRHPAGEMYIPQVGGAKIVSCSGQENAKCAAQFNDPLDWLLTLDKLLESDVHGGPYAGVNIKC